MFRKTPILSKFWVQGPPRVNPLGSKLSWYPPDQNPGSTTERWINKSLD